MLLTRQRQLLEVGMGESDPPPKLGAFSSRGRRRETIKRENNNYAGLHLRANFS